MCGINGILAYGAAADPVNPFELRATRDSMLRRGPDGSGEWIAARGRVGLAHRRLSIIDLSDQAAQPMLDADGTLAVTFNGEIYNYRALREELMARGRTFRTQSDTEVLLALYAEEGEAMVHRLRGMFAFGLYDLREGRLLLARDPYGIKPLYYADDGSTLRFASQVKALLAGGQVSRALDPAGQVGFYLFGSVPEPYTIRRAIKAVPAGCVLWADERGVRPPRRYFSMPECFAAAPERSNVRDGAYELQDRIRGALADSVRHHMVADVRVGAFLSAGVDSGALLGLMSELGQGPIEAVTLGFDEFSGREEDEVPMSREVAAAYGAIHTVRRVSQREFGSDLPAILDAMDQPSIDGVNTWFVSKAARERGLKVAISGLGGDELFGGYPAFRELPRWVKLLRWPQRVPTLGRSLRSVAAPVLERWSWASPKLAGMVEYGGTYPGAYLLRRGLFMPWELPKLLHPEVAAEGLERLRPHDLIAQQLTPDPGSDFARVAVLEASLYMRNQLLRDCDWASMAHSLEVRVPLVDAFLLRALAPSLKDGSSNCGKRLIAQSPRRPLPPELVRRRKTGFTTPIERWLSNDARLGARPASQPHSFGKPQHWSRRLAHALGESV